MKASDSLASRNFVAELTCRRKRNTIDYTFSNVATETEVKEILVQAKQFYVEVEDWITKNHPVLKM